MGKTSFEGKVPKGESIEHVARNSPRAKSGDKFIDAALVKEHLDGSHPDFEHTVAISDNGAIVVTGRVSKRMKEYLEAAARQS